jgi:hypothetical protein
MKHMEHVGSSGDIESFFSWQWVIKHGDCMEIPNLNRHFDTTEGTPSTRRGQSPRFFFTSLEGQCLPWLIGCGYVGGLSNNEDICRLKQLNPKSSDSWIPYWVANYPRILSSLYLVISLVHPVG